MGDKFIDLTGRVFDKLTVIKTTPAPPHVKDKKRKYWLCQCECGSQRIVIGKDLRNSHTTSCGYCIRIGRATWVLSDKDRAIKSTAKKVFDTYYTDGDLTFDDFYNMSLLNCYYCGVEPQNKVNIFTQGNKPVSQFAIDNGWFVYNGLDKIDNNREHDKDNVVPCCVVCNSFKLDTTLEDFEIRVSRLKQVIWFKTANSLYDGISLNDLKSLYPEKRKNRTGSSLMEKVGHIKQSAKLRNISFDLTQEQCAKLVISPCIYCDFLPNPHNLIYTGVDRLDNSKGYCANNCVSACRYCNVAKCDMSVEEFLEWILMVKSSQSKKKDEGL